MLEKIVDKSGVTRYYFNGELHREDGPAVEHANGSKVWYLSGKRHREDGPAVELANADKQWWLNGALHREDGPAVERANGDKVWWLKGREFKSKEEWFESLNEEDKIKALFGENFING